MTLGLHLARYAGLLAGVPSGAPRAEAYTTQVAMARALALGHRMTGWRACAGFQIARCRACGRLLTVGPAGIAGATISGGRCKEAGSRVNVRKANYKGRGRG